MAEKKKSEQEYLRGTKSPGASPEGHKQKIGPEGDRKGKSDRG